MVGSPMSLVEGKTGKALAFTGGGFVDNIPRVLPKNLDVVIRKGSWDLLPIFRLIVKKGEVPEDELYQVFNMGIGMVVIVSAKRAGEVIRLIRRNQRQAWIIGEVVRGTGASRVV